ncbi:hypothetical protein NKR19_g1375 [Coniochaeta hoffmannii]|uniref:Uncharacterized protein n=1 Tax=Coniochaeta hoffmannii TaxID=91930 RepID=A0AA38RYP9_9PEZI|nr:hypothetical protein NKR19_g1375 [Coniochaeta hoffmannii]
MKHSSVRDEYPALRHVWTPYDPELHFRAWYKGATNLIWLCVCAERVYRQCRHLEDFFTFNQNLHELSKSVREREARMSEGVPPPSPLLGPLRARFPGDLTFAQETDREDSLSDLSLEDADYQYTESIKVLESVEQDVEGPARQHGSETIGEGDLTLEDLSGEAVVEHVEDPERAWSPEELALLALQHYPEDLLLSPKEGPKDLDLPLSPEEDSHVQGGDNTEDDWPLFREEDPRPGGSPEPFKTVQSDQDVSEGATQSRRLREDQCGRVYAKTQPDISAGPSSGENAPAPSNAQASFYEEGDALAASSSVAQNVHPGTELRVSDDAPAQSEVPQSQNLEREPPRDRSPKAQSNPPRPHAAEQDPEPEPEPETEFYL